MITFRNNLLILLTTILVVSFILLGLVLGNTMSDALIKSSKKTLKSEMMATNEIIIHNKNDKEKLKEKLQTLHSDLNMTVQVMSGSTVIYESLSKDNMKKHQNTINEYEKRAEDKPYDYHYYISVKDNMQLMVYKGEQDQIITLYKPFTTPFEFMKQMWLYLCLILIIVLPIIYIFVRYINRRYVKPIKEVSSASKMLSEGNYKVRVAESNVVETNELYSTINELARTLQTLNNEQKIQRNRLETTLSNIPLAILMINKYDEVVIANDTYLNLFNKDQTIIKKRYQDVIDNTLVMNMVTQAMNNEVTVYRNVPIQMGVYTKHFEITAVPVLSPNKKKIQGVVLVEHDITQLIHLEQMRRDFVANVSHELKTPITSIKGFTETLLDGAKDDPLLLQDFLTIIEKESHRIQSLVEELLELSKIEQSSNVDLSHVDVVDTLEQVIEMLSLTALEKNINIELTSPSSMTVIAEASKLKQVFINIISNAINYTEVDPQDKNKDIYITVEPSEGDVYIHIKDHGIGIPESDQSRIFERFYRVDKARSRQSGGTGLGLAIVKHIVEVFGGEITFVSKPNEGSTFTVKLLGGQQHVE